MGLHLRRQIVLRVKQLLETDVPDVTSVKAGRAAPTSAAALPCLLVYARAEDSRPSTLDAPGGARQQRRLMLAVDIVHEDPEDDDGVADGFALLVEQAMASDPTLGGLVQDLELARTLLDARAEGETRLGRTRLEFAIEYHTTALRPDQSLS